MRSPRFLICAIAGFGWLTSLAAAPNPSVSDYQMALRCGRQSVSESAFVDAVTQFEAALRARPNDPVALSELGWAALQAGDLARARAATENALATTKDRALLAASLYNLGRIAEATDDRNAAMAAYRRSLTLRKSAEVTARLAAIDTSTPAAMPLTVAPFQGPFVSVDAFCKRARKEATSICPAPFSTGNDYFALHETLTNPPLAMQSVRVVSIRPHNDTVNDCHLLVQTGSGFYSLALRSENGCTPRELT
ncbi:MAG: tetratricopeptide repeat protein, partial [Myxococcales bacterium]|nr:tetratricopeptide repeat protein [Myxococcales bacterium]